MAGLPELGEGEDLGVEGGVGGAGPLAAVDDEVARGGDERVIEGGEVDLDDGEGGGVVVVAGSW